MVNREDSIDETRNDVCKCQQFETRSFAKNIFTGKTTLNDADKDQRELLTEIVDFNKGTKPEHIQTKKQKRNTYESINALYEGMEMVLNAFKSGIFLLPSTKGVDLKISAPKEMLQILPIALAQVKASKTSEDLLN